MLSEVEEVLWKVPDILKHVFVFVLTNWLIDWLNDWLIDFCLLDKEKMMRNDNEVSSLSEQMKILSDTSGGCWTTERERTEVSGSDFTSLKCFWQRLSVYAGPANKSRADPSTETLDSGGKSGSEWIRSGSGWPTTTVGGRRIGFIFRIEPTLKLTYRVTDKEMRWGQEKRARDECPDYWIQQPLSAECSR